MLFKAVERERVWVLKTVVDYGHIKVVFRASSSSLRLSLKSQNLPTVNNLINAGGVC